MRQDDLIRYAIFAVLIALALFIRIRRIGRMQPLRLQTMWIIPVVFLAFAATLFWQYPPSGRGWLWVGVGFAAGGGLGWWRARLVEVSRDAETGQLMQRSSPAALLFLILLMLVRWGLRYAVMLGDERWHFGALLISDIFVALALGVLSFYRVELYLRARGLSRPA